MIFRKLICAAVVGSCMASTAAAQDYFSAAVPDSMALVTISCAAVRTLPGHAQELSSQAVMGTPVRLLDYDGGWWHVETPEGYTGYIIAHSLKRLSASQYEGWRNSDRVVVCGTGPARMAGPDGPVSDVHTESVLEVVAVDGDSVAVRTPDGRVGRLPASAVRDLRWFDTHRLDIDAMIARGKQFMGESYLWGGTTSAAMDCSGLVKVMYAGEGVILRRDASQQFVCGQKLGKDYHEYLPGDLVFFESASTGNIVHVGMYIGDGLYLHCSGMVKINSLDENSPKYLSANILAGACRVKGWEGTPGIIPLASHPWYHAAE